MNQAQALNVLETGANVFLTGEPGSGKTYTINRYVEYLRSHGIEPAITASTGIAATHINGMTIHSWSGIGIKNRLSQSDVRAIAANDYVKKRVGRAKILIIDEISMLPPQTLQMVDMIVREVKKNHAPFGGMQVVLVGDFFQLPPVVRNSYNEESQENLFENKPIRFAYDSPIFEQAEFVTCYIDEQYRQDDSELLSVLGKIRTNSFDDISLALIEQRKVDQANAPADAPKLYSHNIDVDEVNNRMLSKIPGTAQLFLMNTKGHEALIAVMKKGCLSPERLHLKVGASVMFTKNNQKEGFVNGTLGTVVDFNEETGLPIVKIRSGKKIEVAPSEWTVEEDGKIKGRLAQLPLRLAWAITVHKSQGISLDEAVIDLSKVFEFGQGYVALSRVRRLKGLYILGWNDVAFQVDSDVLKKDEGFRINSSGAEKVYQGFDKEELSKMKDDFIARCGGEINASNVILKDKKKKISTCDKTLLLWKEGMRIKEIAELREMNERTVLDHIEALVKNKKIKKDELIETVSPEFFSVVPIIHGVFKSYDSDKLGPVYEFFDGKYSYDELKLARMMMKK
jgi:ATP-dependent exoDNAse (exonuclease V) alpha subunit